MIEEVSFSTSELMEGESIEVPEILPLMAIRDIVLFPGMIIPLFVGREKSLEAVSEALAGEKLLTLVTQKDPAEEDPAPEALFKVGVVGLIIRTFKLPEDRLKVLVQVLARVEVKEFLQLQPFFKARVLPVKEKEPEHLSVEAEALLRNVRETAEKVLALRGLLNPDLSAMFGSVDEPGRLADLVAAHVRFKVSEAQELLETYDGLERLQKMARYLHRELEVATLQAKIQSEAQEEMARSQREYFLREQLRAIKRELGETDELEAEIEELREKIQKARMPKEVEKEALKQLSRLEMMHPDTAEATVIRNYLDWLIELPWRKSTKDKLDLKRAKEILDEDHYDLDKVKERLLEYLAVKKLNPKAKGPILCFVGPPGVGKTSLGRSIARALGRKFVRVS
ncbi:MAG TPA: AAA family ATPase, partial [Thermodesulfobacteriaceae bacterium]|nr:AAA family ATPase [Thermodesulfobacteriaceae bacterium]